MGKLISVVLPTFNEEANILPFCRALTQVLERDLGGCAYEIIYVNDGSSDGTWQKLKEVAADNSRIRLVRFSRNFGHQAALTAGLDLAKGDAVVTMDCDFQDPPELIPLMLKKWQDGSKVVYARRKARVDTIFKKMTAGLFYRLLGRLSDVQIPGQVADYRLMDRVVVENLLKLKEQARYLRGMVAWLGFDHAFVDFDRPDRLHGETHYPLRRMLRFAMDGLLSFSFSPLKLALWVGMLSMCVALGFFGYMLWDHFGRGVPYPLFKWLTVILFGFMGAQFILIWVLGEYIGRIYGDVRNRPLYVVEEAINTAP